MKITSTDKEEKKKPDLLDTPVPYALKLANHKPPNYFCNKQYNTYSLRSNTDPPAANIFYNSLYQYYPHTHTFLTKLPKV